MRNIRTILTVLSIIGLISPTAIYGLTVSGTITDAFTPTAVPVPSILIEVRKVAGLGSSVVEYVYTNAAGQYSSSSVTSGDKIFIRAKWQLALAPNYHWRVIDVVKNIGNDLDPKDSPSQVVTANTAINLQMDQVAPAGLDTLQQRVVGVLDFVRTNKGTSGWDFSNNIPVEVVANSSGSWYSSWGRKMYLEQATIDATTNPYAKAVLVHEMGHLIHHHFGASLTGSGDHFYNSEKSRGGAFTEGWAEFFSNMVCPSLGLSPDQEAIARDDGSYNAVRFPANTLWRGDEGNSSSSRQTTTATGRDGTTFESGEKVEGTIAGILNEALNGGTLSAIDIIEIMVSAKPSDFRSFFNGVRSKFGSGHAKVQAVCDIMQRHGIVYSRAKLAGSPFKVSGPPNAAPWSGGNYAVIEDYTFLRGIVPTAFTKCSSGDLGVGSAIDVKEVWLGFGTAADDLNGSVSSVSAFTSVVPYGDGKVQWDTRTHADGDFDVVVWSTNVENFVDNMLPVWTGDANADCDTDEKYFKWLRAWYDRDNKPNTNPAKEGKVIIDNTAPYVVSGSAKLN